MKLKLSRKAFTLILAVLIGAAMTPCVLRAQSQSSTTTSTSTSKASKRKAKREAKKAAREKAAAEKKAGEQSSAAATSTKSEAANTSATTRSSARNHHEVDTSHSATPPEPGMVWANTSTHVYHKSGSRWAGHTKNGKWMTEADAQKAGYKAAKN